MDKRMKKALVACAVLELEEICGSYVGCWAVTLYDSEPDSEDYNEAMESLKRVNRAATVEDMVGDLRKCTRGLVEKLGNETVMKLAGKVFDRAWAETVKENPALASVRV